MVRCTKGASGPHARVRTPLAVTSVTVAEDTAYAATTSFDYDELGRLIRRTDPATATRHQGDLAL